MQINHKIGLIRIRESSLVSNWYKIKSVNSELAQEWIAIHMDDSNLINAIHIQCLFSCINFSGIWKSKRPSEKSECLYCEKKPKGNNFEFFGLLDMSTAM